MGSRFLDASKWMICCQNRVCESIGNSIRIQICTLFRSINLLDLLSFEDMVAIHKAMEQQTITLSKARNLHVFLFSAVPASMGKH